MAGIAPISVTINSQVNSTTHGNAPEVTGVAKATRVAGQSQDNVVNIATASTQNSEKNSQFAHQRHIALQGYINFNQAQGSEDKSADPQAAQNKGVNGKELTEQELAEVEKMKERDEEVRVHEMAHKRAGGHYAANPTYSYETGPDGKRYITDGEVNIDIGEEKDPQATIEKMQVVKRAAMAPAEPSGQDRKVYQDASQKEAKARQELAEIKQEEAQERRDKVKEALNGNADAKSAINDKQEEENSPKSNQELVEKSNEIKKPKSSEPPRSLDTSAFS